MNERQGDIIKCLRCEHTIDISKEKPQIHKNGK